LKYFEEVHPHQDFATAQGKEERSGFGELVQHIPDFPGGHLSMIVVVEVAVHASLVAAIGDIQMNSQGDTKLQGALVHLLQQGHAASSMGESESTRMPCFESSS